MEYFMNFRHRFVSSDQFGNVYKRNAIFAFSLLLKLLKNSVYLIRTQQKKSCLHLYDEDKQSNKKKLVTRPSLVQKKFVAEKTRLISIVLN